VIGDFANRQQSGSEQLGVGSAYLARFKVLSRLIWPSVCPLLQRSITALRTACMSISKVLAKFVTAGMPHSLASANHPSTFVPL
jgi:hypothetical protein